MAEGLFYQLVNAEHYGANVSECYLHAYAERLPYFVILARRVRSTGFIHGDLTLQEYGKLTSYTSVACRVRSTGFIHGAGTRRTDITYNIYIYIYIEQTMFKTQDSTHRYKEKKNTT